MKILKYFSFILLLITASKIYSQQKNILIFDPNGVSESFQYSLSQLTADSVFVADTIDESVLNYDALFLFISYPFELTNEEGNILINYVDSSKPVYIYSQLWSELDSVAFWNHIGINNIAWLTISVIVDSVSGIDGFFTNGLIIDTSFISSSVPVVEGNIDSILIGYAEPIDVFTTYKSSYDSMKVVVDLCNLIDDEGFLRKVLENFELIAPQQNVEIGFYPPTDTGYIFGGCCPPGIICTTRTNVSDIILIEPENFTQFFYDSSGALIPTNGFYFSVFDSANVFEYELWYHPEFSTNTIQIEFDSSFQIDANNFDIQLIVKRNGLRIDSLSQAFHADFGLGVDDEASIPEEFHLSQNYPNPFNPSTRIKYDIPVQGLVTLVVYDVLGNEVAKLLNEEKSAGSYEIKLDGSSLPSGIYFYQLKAGNYVETKKMILLK